MKVHVEAIHFSVDEKLENWMNEKIQKLLKIYDNIVDATVILKLESSGKIKDKIAEVKLVIPGGVIFIKEKSKSFEAAFDAAYDVLRRQLIKFKERKNI
jgi:putative sigma-54 modulation protein